MIPQAPQFDGSTRGLTQAPLQLTWSRGHTGVHLPTLQVSKSEQRMLQPPQFLGSLETLVQLPLQSAEPGPQVVTH